MSGVLRFEHTERVITYSIHLPCVAGDISKLYQQAATEAANTHNVDTTFEDWAKVTSDGDTLVLSFMVTTT